MPKPRPPPSRVPLLAALCALGLSSTGCEPTPPSPEPVPGQEAPAPAALTGPFAVIPRALAPVEQQRVQEGLAQGLGTPSGRVPETFYLAIRKSELGQRWFLSTFIRQFYPVDRFEKGQPLSTRVVSFQVQNGKLYVFDVDDRKTSSTVFDPELIVEAYPIITGHPLFDALPGARDYVLFDPSAGLNRFGAVGDHLSNYSVRFQVELAFAQAFRALEDGVAFEQLFTGYAQAVLFTPTGPLAVESNRYRLSGTLDIALRRYQEGPGYTPTPMPAREHYFRAPPSRIPDSGSQLRQIARKWNVYPGMKPITWVLPRELLEVQKDPRYQAYDLVGAFRRGVENWNEAFGFQVLTARMAEPGESYSDDRLNFLILDTDPTSNTALGMNRVNPNTGEIIGANVYMSTWFIDTYHRGQRDDPPATADTAAAPAPGAISLTWNGEGAEPLCTLHGPELERALTAEEATAEPAVASLTKKEKVESLLTSIVLHEIGHTLGLRHNFKGSFSLPSPSNSVMDYLLQFDMIRRTTPGPYDVDAIRHLYGLSSVPPTQPFCTDEGTVVDPDCGRFDRSSDPLENHFGFYYAWDLEDALAGLMPLPDDYYLNAMLGWVRAGATSDRKLRAWNITTFQVRAPLSPEQLARPGYAALSDAMMGRIFRRLYLDPATLRGDITVDVPADPKLTPAILEQLRAHLRNVDGVRSFNTRKAVVDVLKKQQRFDAYAVLTEGRDALQAQLPGLSGQQRMETEDLLARIHRALSPYFD